MTTVLVDDGMGVVVVALVEILAANHRNPHQVHGIQLLEKKKAV
jgi:hypothetical protein